MATTTRVSSGRPGRSRLFSIGSSVLLRPGAPSEGLPGSRDTVHPTNSPSGGPASRAESALPGPAAFARLGNPDPPLSPSPRAEPLILHGFSLARHLL